MKTLILVLVLLSSCDQMYQSEKAKDPEVIMCAAKQRTSLVDSALMYYIAGSLDRAAVDGQLKITMNGEVMLDTCSATSTDGFGIYPDYDVFYLYFNFSKSEAWLATYVGSSGIPKSSDLDLKIETRARCQEEWREAVPPTTTSLSWQYTGGCAPPGYYGQFSVPLGN